MGAARLPAAVSFGAAAPRSPAFLVAWPVNIPGAVGVRGGPAATIPRPGHRLAGRLALVGLRALRFEVALEREHHQPTRRHPVLTRVGLGAAPQLQIVRPDIDRYLPTN